MENKIWTLLLFVAGFTCLNAQDKSSPAVQKYAPDMIFVSGSGNTNSFYISRYEVRNKDYLTYLSWLERVYVDYPEVYRNALPENIREEDYPAYLKGLYEYYQNHPDDYGKALPDTFIMHEYLFNPAFRNFPVLGISAQQAIRYCKWLTDRFNEFLLFSYDILMKDPGHLNDETYSYESHMMRQYEGLISSWLYDPETGGERRIRWSDHLMVPAFRLPDTAEWKMALELSHKDEVNIKYRKLSCKEPYGRNPFLEPFYEMYLEKDKYSAFNKWKYYQNEVQGDNYQGEIFPVCRESKKPFNGFNNNVGEWVATSYENEKTYHLKDFEGEKKDSLGLFPYIHVDDDENGEPIFFHRKLPDTEYIVTGNETTYTGFRVAMNATIIEEL